MYKNILMGQTTFDGLPRKLADRYITVASIDPNYHPQDAAVTNDLKGFLEEHEDDETEYIICGGASIFNQAYPYAKKAYVSFVKEEYEVDTWFNVFEMEDWDIVLEEDHPDFVYRELVRKSEK